MCCADYSKARLREYLRITGELLKRNWQWLVLLLGFFFFVIDFKALTAPLAAVVLKAQSLDGLLLLWVLHALALLSVAMQKHAVLGGDFRFYVGTLPVSRHREWRITLAVLVLSNHLFWVYLPLSFLHLNGAGELLALLLLAFFIISAGLLILLIQKAYIDKDVKSILLIFVFDAALCLFPKMLGGEILLAVYVLTAVVALFYLFCFPVRIHGDPVSWAWEKHFPTSGHHAYAISRYMPVALLIPQQILLQKYPAKLFRALILSLLVCGFFSATLIWGDNPSLADGFLKICGVFVVFFYSGLFKSLDVEHAQMRAYLRTLPIGRFTVALRDWLYLALLSLLTLMPPLLLWWQQGHLSIAALLPSLSIWLLLLALLQIAQVLGGRHSVLFVSSLTVATAALAVQI